MTNGTRGGEGPASRLARSLPLGKTRYPLYRRLSGYQGRSGQVRKILPGERPQAAHLLRSWVRIPQGAWLFVCCECRVLSGRGLCDELITRPEESYRLCCVVLCDLETSRMGAPYIYNVRLLRVNRACVYVVSYWVK